MKQNLGAKALIYPQPVLLVATYNDDGTPNAMTAAWGNVVDWAKIAIVIDKNHRTTHNLKKTGAFTLSVADARYVTEADYLGIVSANDVADKLSLTNLRVEKSSAVNAPILSDFYLTLECRLIKYDDETEMAWAEVVNCLADDEILTDGKIDLTKFAPITYDAFNHDYIALGKKVGNAFSDGKALKK